MQRISENKLYISLLLVVTLVTYFLVFIYLIFIVLQTGLVGIPYLNNRFLNYRIL